MVKIDFEQLEKEIEKYLKKVNKKYWHNRIKEV